MADDSTHIRMPGIDRMAVISFLKARIRRAASVG